jgi:hypothetical protein
MQVDSFEGWTQKGHSWWKWGTPEIS